MEDECLLWGIRVIIPQKFQVQLLKELHISHLGIVRMKALSRRHIWWPGIDRAIEEVAKRCSACQRLSKDPEMVTFHPWVWPDTPFQRIHVDFAGPFLEKNFSLWWTLIQSEWRSYRCLEPPPGLQFKHFEIFLLDMESPKSYCLTMDHNLHQLNLRNS